MPDLANLSISDSVTVSHCPSLKSLSATDPPAQSLVKTLGVDCDSDQRMGFATPAKWRERNWGFQRLAAHCLSFAEQRNWPNVLFAHHFVYPGEEVLCSVRGCQGIYHGVCVKERPGNMKKFTCPQHACFICKQRFCRQRLRWRCVCCPIASHDKCTAWPEKVMHLIGQPRRAVCWRHSTDWRQERKHAVSASNIESFIRNSKDLACSISNMFKYKENNYAPVIDFSSTFRRYSFTLPLPYTDEEFKIDLTWKHTGEQYRATFHNTLIRRNLYLVKKKRDDVDDDVGCRGCTSTCSLDCVCRYLIIFHSYASTLAHIFIAVGSCISCSKACHCSENCTNRPFLKEKKIRIVKTAHCGWGAEAAESVKKGEFIIEASGGGETRVGVFAARSIEVGEPLTYDYRFVQFGPEVKCCCGAPNCQGYLGTKKKICKVLSWGKKRKRTTACMAILG
ncbi:hypothetical protein M0R45_019337 [Rubus argutus]|uniref:Post-SET domain-containing protein n=1 Tax=Rubus argutus TaxID=59490 RepID=A0AAW1X8N8_RUBAR